MRAGLLALVVLTGCAGVRFRTDGARLGTLLDEASEQGLALKDPLQLSAEMREAAIVQVGRQGTELERMRRLNAWLRSAEVGLGFTYNGGATRTASEAFEARDGDCLSYAFMFTAMARSLGVGMNFVRYREAQTFDERAGQFVVVSHVASLFSNYRMSVLVELSGQPPSTRVSDFEHIGDDEAAALFMSNLAMEAFAKGERKGPEKVLKFLVRKTPGLPEVRSNLAAVLLRQAKAKEALAVVQAGLEQFPSFVPLYVNGAVAARGVGDETLSAQYAEKARSSWTDPFLPFVKGVWLYEKQHYAASEQLIKRARQLSPNSALFAAWLARVELKEGRLEDALQSLEAAEALNPLHPMIEELRSKDLVAFNQARAAPAAP